MDNLWVVMVDEKPLRVMWTCPECYQFLVHVNGEFYCWFCAHLGCGLGDSDA